VARASFDHANFLTAARDLAAAGGSAAVTVLSVTERLGAQSGSFYYRFASRDVLLAELWLATALAFQNGFVAAIKHGDGPAAALHTPTWVRAHLTDARLFLLYHRDYFVQGVWPQALKSGVARQARRVDACYKRFARDTLGGVDAERLRVARFVLADAPKSAVEPHLRHGEPPPPIVDAMVEVTYRAVIKTYRQATEENGYPQPPGARRRMTGSSTRRS
jgi:AcrR family transcriptional regulator